MTEKIRLTQEEVDAIIEASKNGLDSVRISRLNGRSASAICSVLRMYRGREGTTASAHIRECVQSYKISHGEMPPLLTVDFTEETQEVLPFSEEEISEKELCIDAIIKALEKLKKL